jgi:hypothetical protein
VSVTPGRSERRRRISFGAQADQRLAEFGLSQALLRGAVERGDEGRQRSATSFHPRQSAGQAMWGDTVAALRRELRRLQQGWDIGRTKNYDTSFNLGKRMAIAVVGGDEFTGVLGKKDPRVRRKRGPVTESRVKHNFLQTVLEPFTDEVAVETDEDCDTWFLLIYADENAIYIELSLPILLDSKGYISEWDERIVLDRLEIVGGVTPLDLDDEDGDGQSLVAPK